MLPFESLYGRRCRSTIGWFEDGDVKLLCVDLLKEAQERVRFRKKGKFIPRYIGLFEILGGIKLVAYKLALSPNLSGVHPVFHMSMLKKYHGDEDYIIK